VNIQEKPRLVSVTDFSRVGFYQWTDLRACILKATNNNLLVEGTLEPSPPNRAILVGKFFHRVMELSARLSSERDLEAGIERSIAELQTQVIDLGVDDNLGRVSSWRNVNKAAVLAMDAFRRRSSSALPVVGYTEQLLASRSGLLVGKPDSIVMRDRAAWIIEYKSSNPIDENGALRKEYREQLLFYAALAIQNYAIQEIAGVVRSISGAETTYKIDSSDALETLERAELDVRSANAAIDVAQRKDELGRPSAAACESCAKRIICQSFIHQQHSFSFQSAAYVLAGTFTSAPKTVHGRVERAVLRELSSGVEREIVSSEGFPDLRASTVVTISNLRRVGAEFHVSRQSRIYAE
jgi:hypothetical protein